MAIFIDINQAYFMGLLFLISGYFSPQSLDRKGPARFVRDRLIRLGIPLVVFYFVLNSTASLGFNFLLKFGLAAVITVPLFFAAAYLVLKIPLASRAL
jgi:glucans biosynthesis protein C